MTTLAPLTRGDTFEYSFELSGDWTGAHFSGGVAFTMRTTKPATTVVDDTDAFHQSTVANGEIVFDGAVGTVTITASVTTTWGPRSYFWDLQGIVTGPPDRVYTIDSGSVSVTPDITRSQGQPITP
jgi:hypothetical protein